MRKGKQENKGQERKSGNWTKERAEKMKDVVGAFSDHLELGVAPKIGAQGTPCPLLTINSTPSQEERLLGEKCKYHSETCVM